MDAAQTPILASDLLLNGGDCKTHIFPLGIHGYLKWRPLTVLTTLERKCSGTSWNGETLWPNLSLLKQPVYGIFFINSTKFIMSASRRWPSILVSQQKTNKENNPFPICRANPIQVRQWPTGGGMSSYENVLCCIHNQLIGGWTNPFEKYARQIIQFPKFRGENEKYLKPPPNQLKHRQGQPAWCNRTTRSFARRFVYIYLNTLRDLLVTLWKLWEGPNWCILRILLHRHKPSVGTKTWLTDITSSKSLKCLDTMGDTFRFPPLFSKTPAVPLSLMNSCLVDARIPIFIYCTYNSLLKQLVVSTYLLETHKSKLGYLPEKIGFSMTQKSFPRNQELDSPFHGSKATFLTQIQGVHRPGKKWDRFFPTDLKFI